MPAIKDTMNEIPPLLNPPLLEAFFEVRWGLLVDPQTQRMRDTAYPMMVGRMYEKFKSDFPVIEDLPTTQMHPEANPFVVRHRMRKEKGYPLVQVGPGVATISEAKNYSWSEYKKLILRVIDSIVELYPPGVFPLNFIRSELRYVNAVFLQPSENPLAFLAQKLHTKIELPQGLLQSNSIGGAPNGVGLNVGFPLQKPEGGLMIGAQLGEIDGRAAYVVQTMIQSAGETTPHDLAHFDSWLELAHTAAENCFLSLCKGALMEEFCGS